MRIDPNAQFAGLPLGRVRAAVKKLHSRDWTMDDLREELRVDEATCERVAGRLRAEGMIELAHQWPNGASVWRTTIRGGGLVNASTTAKIPRTHAERHLRGLLRRVRKVNASDRFLYRIRWIKLFGSLLHADRRFVSDADVAVEVEPKEQDNARHRALMERRAAEASRGGKRFSDPQERTWWGLVEVWRYLQGDSKLLHLVPAEDKVLEHTETQLLYEDAAGTGHAQATASGHP
ncbi:MAG: hypothetical protein ACRDKW_00840 [Actinomycetota bacterium]